jgi:hypothetical protein
MRIYVWREIGLYLNREATWVEREMNDLHQDHIQTQNHLQIFKKSPNIYTWFSICSHKYKKIIKYFYLLFGL